MTSRWGVRHNPPGSRSGHGREFTIACPGAVCAARARKLKSSSGKEVNRSSSRIPRKKSSRSMPRVATHTAMRSFLMPAARRLPATYAPHVQGSIRHDGSCRYSDEVNRKAQQPLIDDVSWRQSYDGGRTEPSRKNGELHCRGDADQVTPAGIVRIRQSGCDADDGRYGEAGQRRLESGETHRAAGEPRHGEAAQERQGRTRQKRANAAQDQPPIAGPQAKAHGQNLSEEGQEERRDNDGDGIVVDDACGEKDSARSGASDIAGCHVAQLPQVLYHVGKRFAHWPGHLSEIRAVDNRTQLARGQRVFRGRKNGRGQQRLDEQAGVRRGSFHTHDLLTKVGSININVGDRDALDSGSVGQPRRFRYIFGGHCRPDFMHDVPLLAVVWTIKICPI